MKAHEAKLHSLKGDALKQSVAQRPTLFDLYLAPAPAMCAHTRTRAHMQAAHMHFNPARAFPPRKHTVANMHARIVSRSEAHIVPPGLLQVQTGVSLGQNEAPESSPYGPSEAIQVMLD